MFNKMFPIFKNLILLTFSVFHSIVSQEFSSLSTGGPESRIKSCAKCFYMDGSLPFNLQSQLGALPRDPRCQFWNDGIPTSEYEDCGEPIDGESIACMQLNLTALIQNAVTDFLNQGSQGVGSVVDTAGSVINAVSDPLGALTGGTDGAANFGDFGNFGSNLGGLFGRRKKRQVMIGGDNFPGFLSNQANNQGNQNLNPIGAIFGGSPASSPAVSNAIPAPSFQQQLTPVNNIINTAGAFGGSSGASSLKMYYKGCVRLSLLETLAGSHCKLSPQVSDIRFFSQQALLQPLMSMIDTIESTAGGAVAGQTKVDGLCYVFSKEFARVLWSTLMSLSPIGGGSSALGGIGSVVGGSSSLPTSLIQGLGKR